MALTCAQLGVLGLALDVAGAVVLAWSFSTKRPEQIRKEVPKAVGGTDWFGGGVVSAAFPQALREPRPPARGGATGARLARPRFPLQGANALFSLGGLESASERWTVGALALLTWLLTWLLGMRLYVPWDERRTASRIPDSLASGARP